MAMLTMLVRENYTPDQARKAELWLFKGDWSHRGQNARLEGSDFWPRREQWDVDDDLVVMTKDARELLCRKWFENGRNDYRAESLQASEAMVLPETARQLIEAIKRQGELEEEVSALKSRLADYHGTTTWRTRYDDAMGRIAELEAQFLTYRREANMIVKQLLEDKELYFRERGEHLAALAEARKRA